MSWLTEALDEYEDGVTNIEDVKSKAEKVADALRRMIVQKDEVWLDGGVPFFFQRDKDIIQDVIGVLDEVQRL